MPTGNASLHTQHEGKLEALKAAEAEATKAAAAMAVFIVGRVAGGGNPRGNKN